MLFMRFPIDAVFLGPARRRRRRAARRRRCGRALRPWTGVVWWARGADGCLELPVGTIAASGTIVGDLVLLGEVDAERADERPVSDRDGRSPRPSFGVMGVVQLGSPPRPARWPAGSSTSRSRRSASDAGTRGPRCVAHARRALTVRRGRAGRHAHRDAVRRAAPARPARVVRPVRRARPRRAPRPQVPRRAAPRRAARRGRPPRGGGRRRSAATCWSTCRCIQRGAPCAATTRPSCSRGLRRLSSGARSLPALRRERATAPQYELGRDRRAANVAAAFAVDARSSAPRSPAAGSSSSTTS